MFGLTVDASNKSGGIHVKLIFSKWYQVTISNVIGSGGIKQSSKNPIGQMAIAFFFLYNMGLGIAMREQELKIARRKLPKRIKQVLFIGRKNKFALYSIIRQSFFMFSTTLAVLIMLFISNTDRITIIRAYALLSGGIFCVDAIYVIWLLKFEYKQKK